MELETVGGLFDFQGGAVHSKHHKDGSGLIQAIKLYCHRILRVQASTPLWLYGRSDVQ